MFEFSMEEKISKKNRLDVLAARIDFIREAHYQLLNISDLQPRRKSETPPKSTEEWIRKFETDRRDFFKNKSKLYREVIIDLLIEIMCEMDRLEKDLGLSVTRDIREILPKRP